MGGVPVVEILLGNIGHGGIKFDANDLVEREFAGDEHGASFAGADIDKSVVVNGIGRRRFAPECDESAKDAGSDAVICRDVLVVGVAGDEMAGRNEAAGLYTMDLIEGVDGGGGRFEQIARTNGNGLCAHG